MRIFSAFLTAVLGVLAFCADAPAGPMDFVWAAGTSASATGTLGPFPCANANTATFTFISGGGATFTVLTSADKPFSAAYATATSFGTNGVITNPGNNTQSSGTIGQTAVQYVEATYTGNSGTISGTFTCSASVSEASGVPSVVPTSSANNNYAIAQHSTTPTSQPGNEQLQGFQVSTSSSAPSTTMLSNGDFLSSESTTKGRYWAATAPGSAAKAVVYIALTELQTANSLGPQAGDVLTVTVNGHAVAYTVLVGDTTLATLANSVAAAINADSTDAAIVSAAGSSSGQLGLVTITALTSGICCRYGLTTSVSGGSQETLNAFPLLDVAGFYLDYGKNVSGWSMGTDLGDYTFDHSGNFQGLPGHTLNIKNGQGAASAITLNLNNPGAYTGLTIYDGGNNINHADLIYPANVHIFFGPLEQNICAYTANNCTSLPSNPSYVGEWMNVNGSATGPTQHEVSANCAAATSCTINWTVQWTSASSYSCVVTAEGPGDAPYISTKTASQTVFTGSTSVARDFHCVGI